MIGNLLGSLTSVGNMPNDTTLSAWVEVRWSAGQKRCTRISTG